MEQSRSAPIELPPLPENIPSLSDDTRRFIAAGKSKRANDTLIIPRRFRCKGLIDFRGFYLQVERSKAAIDAGASLFIHGDCGTGKTHLAVGLLLRWYAYNGINLKRAGGIFLPVPELFFELKRCYERKEGEGEVLDKYSAASMLVMDDFGAERISEWSRQVFYLIIDRRYRENKQTIFTSNLSLATIASLIDDRISSRIAEMCQEVIRLDGPDRRVEPVEAGEAKPS